MPRPSGYPPEGLFISKLLSVRGFVAGGASHRLRRASHRPALAVHCSRPLRGLRSNVPPPAGGRFARKPPALFGHSLGAPRSGLRLSLRHLREPPRTLTAPTAVGLFGGALSPPFIAHM